MNWNQPICGECWWRLNPGRVPTRLRNPRIEFCCMCNKSTDSGIYVRANPDSVPYPTLKEAD